MQNNNQITAPGSLSSALILLGAVLIGAVLLALGGR